LLKQPHSNFVAENPNLSAFLERGFAKKNINDEIDLNDIDSATAHKVSYSLGVLTIKDGEGHTGQLHFSGTYTLGSFNLDPDGRGGTLLTDPPTAPPTNAALFSCTAAINFITRSRRRPVRVSVKGGLRGQCGRRKVSFAGRWRSCSSANTVMTLRSIHARYATSSILGSRAWKCRSRPCSDRIVKPQKSPKRS
jgi:hypothetical protein